jgi:hypothetical protein
MTVNAAIKIIKKQAEFLNMPFDEILIFVERNPYAFPNSAVTAVGVYNNSPLGGKSGE